MKYSCRLYVNQLIVQVSVWLEMGQTQAEIMKNELLTLSSGHQQKLNYKPEPYKNSKCLTQH